VSGNMTPEELLDVAKQLMTRRRPSMRRSWQRGCACLIRSACEEALRAYWKHTAPSVGGRPMRHQLLALATFADRKAATLARTAWHGLSRAMHHHAYELPPTAAELESWHQDVSELLSLLRPKRT